MQLLPIIRLHLGILYALLRPILVPSTNMVLRLLEEDKLVPDAFLNEHPSSVLSNYRFLVLGLLITISVGRSWSYLNDSLGDLFNLPRFDQALWFCPNRH